MGGEQRTCEAMAFDGVAAMIRGDTIVMLWREAARLHRAKWIFDVSDQLCQRFPDGIFALMIVLPSSDPPDEATRRENQRRLGKLAIRHWVTVVVGDEVRQLLIRAILRVMTTFSLPAAHKTDVRSSISEGIARLCEAAGPDGPRASVIEDDVRELCALLGIPRDELGA
jgi:hypothetical protein